LSALTIRMNTNNVLKKTYAILTVRWPEVMLVTVLQVGLMLLLERAMVVGGAGQTDQGTIPDGAMFALGFGCMLMAVVWQMLYLGFLRTAALNGAAPHEPMTLLVTGRGFFWRLLSVQFVLGAMLWLLAGLLAGLVGSLLGYQSAAAFPRWLLETAGVGAMALLVKPFFLIPALILALNTSIPEALGLMRQFRLGDLGALLKAYALGLTVIAAVAIAATLAPHGTRGYYVASGISHLTQSLIILTLLLATVLFLVPEEEDPDGPAI